MVYITQKHRLLAPLCRHGAPVAVACRGGTSATFDELSKYFTISGMTTARFT